MIDIPSAIRMKTDVSSQLLKLNSAIYLTNKNIKIIEDLVPNSRVNKADFSLCLSDFLKSYFESLCKKLTVAFSGGTPARVEIDDKHYSRNPRSNYNYRPYQDEYAIDHKLFGAISDVDDLAEDETTIIINNIINAIHFDAIHAELTEQCNNLAQTGKSLLADKLVSFLNFEHKNCYPSIKRDRVITDRYSADYWARRGYVTDLQDFVNALVYVSRETDFIFGSAAQELKHAVTHLTYDCQSIPSRTLFGKSQPLEIACFNSKYEFRFTRAGFDAIAAYVTLYGNERSVCSMADVLNSIFTKAA